MGPRDPKTNKHQQLKQDKTQSLLRPSWAHQSLNALLLGLKISPLDGSQIALLMGLTNVIASVDLDGASFALIAAH